MRGVVQWVAAVVLAAFALLGCRPDPQPRSAFIGRFDEPPGVEQPRLAIGPEGPEPTALRQREQPIDNPYRSNRDAIGEGRRLYRWMNCVGCHGEGGGSIGPALWYDQWIYGGRGIDIFQSIYYGRPNGMPPYGGHLPPEEVWKLVAYVQSLQPRGGMFGEGVK